jgi:hypothetical protein
MFFQYKEKDCSDFQINCFQFPIAAGFLSNYKYLPTEKKTHSDNKILFSVSIVETSLFSHFLKVKKVYRADMAFDTPPNNFSPSRTC